MQRHVGPPEKVKNLFMKDNFIFSLVYYLCVQQCRVIERKTLENTASFLFLVGIYLYFKNSESFGTRSYP